MTGADHAAALPRRLGPGLLLAVALIAAAPLLAPQDPTDLARLDLLDALLPPGWQQAGTWRYPLGTDAQGRCLLSLILHGLRLSLAVGGMAVLPALLLGTGIGLWAGYRGGVGGELAMRLADTALALHPVLLALLLAAVLRTVAKPGVGIGTLTVVVALVAVGWAPFARTARALTAAQACLPYVRAAWLLQRPTAHILVGHILPNIAPTLLAQAATQLGAAIVAEATLSFLGAGLPPTQPSLGQLVRTGSEFLASGGWWLAVMPALALSGLIVAIGWLAGRLAAHAG